MKKVFKDFSAVPASLSSPGCIALKALALVQRGQHSFDTGVYGHADVRTALDIIYNSKCAFCETDPNAGMTIQVEHYRPKARVTGQATHPGYYWLGYEWSNLLLACSSCNNKKRNQFPISGTGARVVTHPSNPASYLVNGTELVGESALILNPETLNDPDIHFTYLNSGRIVPKTPEGQKTEEKVGLNRGNLVKARKRILDTCMNEILKSFEDYSNKLIKVEQLEYGILLRIRDLVTIYADNLPYSQFAKHCWLNFQSYIVDRFKTEQQVIVSRVYQRALTLLT